MAVESDATINIKFTKDFYRKQIYKISNANTVYNRINSLFPEDYDSNK